MNKKEVSVIQRLDSAIQWINLYPVDSAISFPSTYPMYSNLSFCSTIQRFNNQEPVPERRNNSILGINVPYFRDNFILE